MIRLAVSRFAAIFLVGLAACSPPDTPYPDAYDADNFTERSDGYKAALRAPEAARAFLGDTTYQRHDVFHGTQIVYLTADGRAHLWYPGNRISLPGTWKIDKRSIGSDLCFRYGPNTHNPVTKQSGSYWSCDMLNAQLRDMTAVVAGDPFNIASGRVPFVLDKRFGSQTHYDIRQRAGLPGPFKNALCAKHGPC